MMTDMMMVMNLTIGMISMMVIIMKDRMMMFEITFMMMVLIANDVRDEDKNENMR